MASTRRKVIIVALAACAVLLAIGWQHGAASPSDVFDLASQQPNCHIFGAQVADKMGQAIAAGDFDGDGVEDILIGADEADGPGNGRPAAGEAYIIFGSPTLGSVVDLASGGAGVTILGADNSDHLGEDVLATGDFNDDGYADAAVATRYADGPGNIRPDAGEVYIIFGSAGISGTVDIASGQQDVTIYGADAGDRLASSIAAGDVNGDGIDDIVLGTWEGDGPANARSRGGEAYVIFGSPALDGVIDLAEGSEDVTIYGAEAGDRLGFSVVSGDFGGDATDDILLTAQWGDGPGNARPLAGEAYVIFGSSELSGAIDVAASQQDFTIYGVGLQDEIGSAAAGDLNGDGTDDIVVVASLANGPLEDRPMAGEAYVVLGPVAQDGVVDVALSEQDLTIYGVDIYDKLAENVYSVTVGDFNGDGLKDILLGSILGDGPANGRNLSGEAYVIFGQPTMEGTIDLASAEQSFSIYIYGAADGDKLGSVAAGDVNGDGADEVLMAAPFADGVAKSRLGCGEAYVISLDDSDGDTLPDFGDPCPTDDDCDDDEFDDYLELYLGTDPQDACPDDPNDDAWPPDVNSGTMGCGFHNGEINITDVLCYKWKLGSNPYDRRYDLNADGNVNILDVLLYKWELGKSCTSP